jgi:hypothetical protein
MLLNKSIKSFIDNQLKAIKAKISKWYHYIAMFNEWVSCQWFFVRLASQKMADSWDIYKWSPRFNLYWSIFTGILLKNSSISSVKRSKSLYRVHGMLHFLCKMFVMKVYSSDTDECKHMKRAKDHWHDTHYLTMPIVWIFRMRISLNIWNINQLKVIQQR